MYNSESLREFHRRAHESLKNLLAHCRQLSAEELNRELAGFGYPTVRLQIHHVIGVEKYWIGVLEGRIDAEDDDLKFPTIESLEAYRQEAFEVTEGYLQGASEEELKTPRPMMTWGDKERVLIPVQVFMRTLTHLYHHQGQVVAMCRLLGKPVPPGGDYPIT